jgi:hypothetical protein
VRWVVYALTDPRFGEVRYIGSTGDARARLYAHVHGNRARCGVWAIGLKAYGVRPDMWILGRYETQGKMLLGEAEWLSKYKRAGANLLNVNRAARSCVGWMSATYFQRRDEHGEEQAK